MNYPDSHQCSDSKLRTTRDVTMTRKQFHGQWYSIWIKFAWSPRRTKRQDQRSCQLHIVSISFSVDVCMWALGHPDDREIETRFRLRQVKDLRRVQGGSEYSVENSSHSCRGLEQVGRVRSSMKEWNFSDENRAPTETKGQEQSGSPYHESLMRRDLVLTRTRVGK